MSTEPQGHTLEEAASYNFGEATAPEGFNPDEAGYRKPPVGEHIMRIDGTRTRILTDQEFNWEGSQYTLCQLRPRLVISDGAHKGASITAFLPMPTPGREWCTGLANQWGNFIKGCGFQIPPGKTVPDGFKIGQLDGCHLRVTVAQRVDRQTKQPVMDSDGTPRMEVKMFGFRPLTEPPTRAIENAPSPAPGRTTSSSSAPAMAGAGAAASSGEFDL